LFSANDSEEEGTIIFACKYPADAIQFYKNNDVDLLAAFLRGAIHAKKTGILKDTVTQRNSTFRSYECIELSYLMSRAGHRFYSHGRVFLVSDTVFYLSALSQSSDRAMQELEALSQSFNIVRAASPAPKAEVPAKQKRPIIKGERPALEEKGA